MTSPSESIGTTIASTIPRLLVIRSEGGVPDRAGEQDAFPFGRTRAQTPRSGAIASARRMDRTSPRAGSGGQMVAHRVLFRQEHELGDVRLEHPTDLVEERRQHCSRSSDTSASCIERCSRTSSSCFVAGQHTLGRRARSIAVGASERAPDPNGSTDMTITATSAERVFTIVSTRSRHRAPGRTVRAPFGHDDRQVDQDRRGRVRRDRRDGGRRPTPRTTSSRGRRAGRRRGTSPGRRRPIAARG